MFTWLYWRILLNVLTIIYNSTQSHTENNRQHFQIHCVELLLILILNQRQQNKKETINNSPHKYRCKNPHQNIIRQNLAIYKKNYTLRPNEVHFRDIWLVQYSKKSIQPTILKG
jgi:hypothetical protein